MFNIKIRLVHVLTFRFTIPVTFYRINLSISDKKRNLKGRSVYECGFKQQDYKRKNISVKFMVLALVFLIFDVELVLLRPLITTVKFRTLKRKVRFFLFYFWLNLGLVLEWKNNAMKT
jgi:NADH:ubiquinone oxidoreductase subunit 3 (subunit A)